MVVPSLEIVYPPNINLAPPGWRPRVNLIFVHDLGGSAKTTWHHDASGKTWISDPDFLGNLKNNVRVWVYGYNSEPAVNMTPASIALHADDLLDSILAAYREYIGGPTIFIAHGLGGTIVKKAAELFSNYVEYFPIGDCTAGIVFLDTVHHCTDSEAVLTAVKTTVAANLQNNSPKPSPEDTRQFAEAVREINKAFGEKVPPSMEILNVVAMRRIEIMSDDASSYKTLVVPKQLGEMKPSQTKTVAVNCHHFQLTQFSSPSDRTYSILSDHFSSMVAKVSTENTSFVLIPPPAPVQLNTSTPRPPSPGPEGPEKKGPPARIPIIHRPPVRDRNNDHFLLWGRKRETESMKMHRDTLVNKLGGWDEIHLGLDIHPLPDTCTWIQRHRFFLEWAKSKNTAICHVSGNAGCGKTHLAKSVGNYLSWDHPHSLSNDSIVLSFFCNVSATGNKKPPIMEYFIRSILRARPQWFDYLATHHRFPQPGSEGFNLASLVDILRDIMAKMQSTAGPPKTTSVFMIVDGLDGCDVTYAREFLRLVGSLIDHPAAGRAPISAPTGPSQGFPREVVNFKFFFTYSPNEIIDLASWKAIRIQMTDDNIRKDISKYVDTVSEGLFKAKSTSEPPSKVCSFIKNEAASFFFFAKYCLEDAVTTAENKDYGYFIKYRRLPCPEMLGRYYDYELLPLFQSIGNNNYVLSTVQIVLGAITDVTRDEIRDAISCLHEDPRLRFLDLQMVVLHQCSRLITVVGDSELYSIHPSFDIHFRSYISEEEQHANMTFLCLKYLSQPIFTGGLSVRMSNDYPFYKYAASNWREHLRQSQDKGLKLLPQLRRFFSSPCYQTWSGYICYEVATTRMTVGTPLYHTYISCSHIPPVIALIEANAAHLAHELQDIHWEQALGQQSWKMETSRLCRFLQRQRQHYPGLGRLLGFWGARQDYWIKDAAGLTPLMHAAMVPEGLPDMIEYFLQWPIDINERDPIYGETALMIMCKRLKPANESLTEHLIISLLKAGADPNFFGFDGETCLLGACSSGQLTTVELLLQAGADPNISTIHGVTPLHEAFTGSYTDIIKILIEYNVDLSLRFRGPSPQIPLTSAITEGYFDVFLLILERVEDVNQLDNGGFAAIHLLTAPMYTDWLPHLLKRPDVDLDVLSDGVSVSTDATAFTRRTPLCFAISDDNFKAAELLLEAGASSCRVPGSTDDTPLYMAVNMARTTTNKNSNGEDDTDDTGNSDIVELLLAYQTPINTIDRKSKRYAKSPLMEAISLKDQRMVELLLRHGADPTLEEAYGLPGPLDAAIDSKEIGMTKVLLENSLPPSINYIPEGFNHILIEASDQSPELVQCLLEHGADTKRFLSPGYSTTPLYRAAEEGNLDVCKLFLQHEPDLVNYQAEEGLVYETPINIAIREGHIEIVRHLLDSGAHPSLPSYHWQETPLWSACHRGRLEIAQLLYEKAPETVNTPSYAGETPLIMACESGNIQLVKFLLEKGADIQARCSMGRSCVCSAISEDNGAAYKIVDLLIQHGLGVDDVVSSIGFTVLGEACQKGDVRTVRYLLEKGADPIKGQKWPGDSSQVWRSALHVASHNGKPQVVAVLLKHPQLASFIGSIDFYGQNVLHMDTTTSNNSLVAAMIYSTCQRLEHETGVDYIQRLLATKNREMHTPLDVALGRPHKGLCSKGVSSVDRIISHYVTELTTPTERTQDKHKHLMGDMAIFLLERGGYDEQAVRLLQSLAVDYCIKEEEGHFLKTAFCVASCDWCEEGENDVLSFCRYCRSTAGPCCAEKFGSVHDFVEIPVIKDRSVMDLNTDEIRDVLSLLERDFVIEKDPRLEQNAPSTPFQVDPDSEETTLSLASLHAMGYLEFRR
ncbi:hypothetical protein EsH8_VI_000902 [Colletotrichum jinshuiense]